MWRNKYFVSISVRLRDLAHYFFLLSLSLCLFYSSLSQFFKCRCLTDANIIRSLSLLLYYDYYCFDSRCKQEWRLIHKQKSLAKCYIRDVLYDFWFHFCSFASLASFFGIRFVCAVLRVQCDAHCAKINLWIAQQMAWIGKMLVMANQFV